MCMSVSLDEPRLGRNGGSDSDQMTSSQISIGFGFSRLLLDDMAYPNPNGLHLHSRRFIRKSLMT